MPTPKWLHDRFAEYLGRGDTRLVVIGYGFGDHHINEIIARAGETSRLKVFINDPTGVGVLRKESVRLSPKPCRSCVAGPPPSPVAGASGAKHQGCLARR